jgi:hypothetical protein
MSHLSYLILNELTLFYFDLSASKTSQTGKIQSWTAQVAKANKKSKEPGPPSTATGTGTTASAFRTTASSSAVVSQAAPTKKKAKHEREAVISAVSAFLDEDESAERDAAHNSPIKGKKRLTTKVHFNS